MTSSIVELVTLFTVCVKTIISDQTGFFRAIFEDLQAMKANEGRTRSRKRRKDKEGHNKVSQARLKKRVQS
jgi:hypothetical protein